MNMLSTISVNNKDLVSSRKAMLVSTTLMDCVELKSFGASIFSIFVYNINKSLRYFL